MWHFGLNLEDSVRSEITLEVVFYEETTLVKMKQFPHFGRGVGVIGGYVEYREG
jgi:hypothetical protein